MLIALIPCSIWACILRLLSCALQPLIMLLQPSYSTWQLPCGVQQSFSSSRSSIKTLLPLQMPLMLIHTNPQICEIRQRIEVIQFSRSFVSQFCGLLTFLVLMTSYSSFVIITVLLGRFRSPSIHSEFRKIAKLLEFHRNYATTVAALPKFRFVRNNLSKSHYEWRSTCVNSLLLVSAE